MKKVRWDLLGIVGGIAGVILGVIAVLRNGGHDRFLIAGAMVLVFGGMGAVLYRLLWQPRFRMRRLLVSGVPARATILETRETSIMINGYPQLKLLLRIRRGTDPAYDATCKIVVTRSRPPAYFQAGREIDVRVDPDDPSSILPV